MVPNGWKLGKISDLANTKMGYAFKSSDFVSFGIPLLRMGNLYQNSLDFSRNPVFLPFSYEKDYDNFLVKPNDLVMSMTGTMGKRDYGFTVQIPEDAPISLLNQRVMKFIAKKGINSSYLKYVLRSEVLLNKLYSFPGGTKQANLSADQVKELSVLIAPLEEQYKISQILSTWDQAILATEKLLENSQQQKKALMQQLLTGKKRLLDENGKRFSGAWKHIKLRSLIKEIKRDKEQNPNNIELLTVKLHNKGAVASGKFPNSTEGGRPYYKRFAGELIIGRQNLHNGGVAIVPSDCNGLIASNAISSFEVLKDCDINFILSIMSTSHFRYVIDNLTGGTGQKEVSVRELLNVFVFIPCIEEQRKIAKVISLANQKIDTLQKKLDCLKQEKKALMQQLLTGKKRVKVAA